MKLLLALFVWDVNRGGGAVSSVKHMITELHRNQIEVVILTTAPVRSIQVKHMDGSKIYYMPPYNLYWVGDKDNQKMVKKVIWQLIDIWNPVMWYNIRRVFQLEVPDIIHVHKLRGLSTAVWEAARSVGIDRIVQTCQDYELLSPEGSLNSCVGQWSNSGRYWMQPYSKCRAWFSRVVRHATSPSEYVLNKLRKHGFFSRANKSIIRNSHGIKLDQLKVIRSIALPSKFIDKNSSTNPINVLFLGRIEKNKGIDWFCDFFARHSRRWPNFRLNIAGWGSLEQTLRKKYGQYSQIVFHGALFGDRKHQLLQRSHVMVVPSVYEEISPVVISEAYAYGIPVIGSRIGGIPELIQDGVTGWLANPLAEDAWIDIFDTIFQETDFLKEMSYKCADVSHGFSPEKITADYLRVYEQL